MYPFELQPEKAVGYLSTSTVLLNITLTILAVIQWPAKARKFMTFDLLFYYVRVNIDLAYGWARFFSPLRMLVYRKRSGSSVI